MNPLYESMKQNVAMPGPMGTMQNVMQRAQQIMSSFRNPQQLVSQMLPGVPAEIRNDPNQIINWMQQTGKVTPQQIQMVKQMIGR